MDSSSTEIVFQCGDFRVYKDGHVERAGSAEETVPAGFDADTGVTSRDVVIDSSSNNSASTTTKLPVLVFFHGGYFVVGSPGHPTYHRYINAMVAGARVVAVYSVRYRLAPEHPLPAAYDDAWAALNWAASGADPWLSEHGGLGRVFVAGVSAGANIAHNVAVAAGVRGLRAPRTPVRVEGVILLHPSFAAEQKIEAEEDEFVRANRVRWVFIFPGAKDGLDDPRINPMAAGAREAVRREDAGLHGVGGPEGAEGAGVPRRRAGQRGGGVVRVQRRGARFLRPQPRQSRGG